MAEKSKILIIGGTGYIGKFIVEASAKSGHPTFALVRESTLSDPAKAKLIDGFKSSGVTLIHGDLNDQENLVNAIKQVDVVISTVGSLQILDQTKIIAAIKEAGNIKRFFPSEFGNDVDRVHAVEPAKSTFGLKAQIRRAIEAEGIPYTYVSSNYFAGYFLPKLAQPGLSAPPRDKVIIPGDGNPKDIAIAKANGSRFMGKTIVVKLAAFNNLGASKSKDLQNTHRPVSFRGPSHEQVTDSRRFTFRGPSFADVVSRKRSSDNTTIIKAQEEDINWLHRSIVASLNAQRSVDSLRDAFITEGVLDIQIRELGANQVLLTFPSSQDLMAMLEGGDMCWIFNFFAEVKQWTPDIKLENSRVIWLNCYGVPINLWNAGTFFSIGKLWGETITLDEATSKKTSFSVGKIKISTSNFEVINHSLNLEHNGVLFPIRVVEEQVVVQNFMKAVCECKGCGFARVVFSPCSGEKLILEQDKLEGNLVAGDKVHTVEMAKLSKDDVNVDSDNLSTSMVGESLCPLRPEVKAVLVDAYLSDGNNVGFGELNKKDTDGGPLGHGNIGDQDKDDNFAPCKDGSRVIGMVFESAKDTLSKEVSDSITSPLPHEQVFDRKRGLSKPPASFPVAKVTTSSSVSVDSDLVSADPLINYVEYMRHKKKARAKKGFQRKPLWTKNPLKAAIFSRKVSRDQIEKRSKPVKLGLKKDSFDGCSLSTEGEASSDICKRNAILIKEARESMEINASLGVKFFGRESYNIKKFLEIQGVDISEQDIKAFIDFEEGASISVEF